jgi:hypothetical protein
VGLPLSKHYNFIQRGPYRGCAGFVVSIQNPKQGVTHMGVAPTYPLRIAAKAAQISKNKQRRWMDTRVVTLRNNDLQATGSGHHCGLSRNRILQTAITEVLLKSGVSLSTAAKAALEFSDSGNNGRAAGELFPLARTVLILTPTGAVVSNVDFDARVSDLSNNGVAIVVDLNAIVAKVDAELANSK